MNQSNPTSSTGTSRREFLSACLRYPVAAGMAGLATVLVIRSKSPGADLACVPICQTCKLFAGCDKPQALETRKAP